jgi:hypothetical protein
MFLAITVTPALIRGRRTEVWAGQPARLWRIRNPGLQDHGQTPLACSFDAQSWQHVIQICAKHLMATAAKTLSGLAQ